RMEKIGFILQATNLVPFLSVKQQFKLLKKQKKDILTDEDYKNMMNQFGLNDLERKLPSEIYGGIKQRDVIEKALYTKISIILIYETCVILDSYKTIVV